MRTLLIFVCLLHVTFGLEQRTCIGGNVNIRCPTWDHILILEEAVYGALPEGNCGDSGVDTCEDPSALTTLVARCHGDPICRFNLEHGEFSGVCPNTSANALLVKYRCIEESEISDLCTSTLESLGTKGYLSSPGYPGKYTIGIDCSLTLVAPPRMVLDIEMKLLDLDLDPSSDCSDVLYITDLNTGMETQYCGPLTAEMQRFFTLNDAKIKFITDDVERQPLRGFLLHYSIEMKEDESANVTLTTEASEIDHSTDIDMEAITIYLSTPKLTSTVLTSTTTTSTTTTQSPWGQHFTRTTTTTIRPSTTILPTIDAPASTSSMLTGEETIAQNNATSMDPSSTSTLSIPVNNVTSSTTMSSMSTMPPAEVTHSSTMSNTEGILSRNEPSSTTSPPPSNVSSSDAMTSPSTMSPSDVTSSGTKSSTDRMSSSNTSSSIIPSDSTTPGNVSIASTLTVPSGEVTSSVMPSPTIVPTSNGSFTSAVFTSTTGMGDVTTSAVPTQITVSLNNVSSTSEMSSSTTMPSGVSASTLSSEGSINGITSSPLSSEGTMSSSEVHVSSSRTTTISSFPNQETTISTTKRTTTMPPSTTIHTTPDSRLSAMNCTGGTLGIRCLSDQFIVIDETIYGHLPGEGCGSPESDVCVSEKALHSVAKACSGKSTCEISVARNIAENECNTENTGLKVFYDCVNANLLVRICGDNPLPAALGYLGSHKYPAKYNKNLRCERELIPPPGFVVRIRILDLELEARLTQGCYDFLIIEDPDNPVMTFQFCGEIHDIGDAERVLILNKARFKFVSDGNKNVLKGFLLYYEVIRAEATTTTAITPTTAPHIQQDSTTATTTSSPTTTSTMAPTTVTVSGRSESITWYEDGVMHTDVCRDSALKANCSEEHSLVILSATYGAHDTSPCSDYSNGTCSPTDVTDFLNGRCSGRNQCLFRVDDEEVLANCGEYAASLYVQYQCVPDSSIKDICTKDELMPEGYLTSPGYPNTYNSGECFRQLIPVSRDAYITVRVLDVNLDARPAPRSGCYDHLLLNDENDLRKFYYYCGMLETITSPRVENYTILGIEFRGDDFATDHRGFLLHYKVHAPNGSDDSLQYDITTQPPTSTTVATTTVEKRSSTTATSSSTQSSSMSTQTMPTTTPLPPLISPDYPVLEKEACDRDEIMVISCDDPDSVIVIEDAVYGNMTSQSCSNSTNDGEICMDSVTGEIAAVCSGFSTCSFEVDSLLFFYYRCGEHVTLKVTYFCVAMADTNICDMPTIQRPDGFISSPGYPEGYPKNKNCSLKILPRNEYATVQVRIYDLEIEARSNQGCYDKFLVSEKDDALHTYTVCGTLHEPKETIPRGLLFSYLQLVFYADGVRPEQHKGFLLYYKIEGEIPVTTKASEVSIDGDQTTQSQKPTTPPANASSQAAQKTSTPQMYTQSSTISPMSSTQSSSVTSSSTSQPSSPQTSGITPSEASSSSATMSTGSSTTLSSTPAIKDTSTTQMPALDTSTTKVDMDLTTEEESIGGQSGKRDRSEEDSGGKSNAGVIAGVIVLLLVLIVLAVLGFLLYQRYKKQSVQKPGRQDLWANTSGPTQDAMNEYTYVDMNSPDPAMYDGNTVPLHAHESALSSPLYDDNKNRTFSRPHTGEAVVVVDDPKDVVANGKSPPHEYSTNNNGDVLSAKIDKGDIDEKETSFGPQDDTDKLVKNTPPPPDYPAPELNRDSSLSDYPAPELNRDSSLSDPEELATSDSTELVAPPADFGESSTDAVNKSQNEHFADASDELQVDEDAPRARRDKSRDDEEDFELSPNPYETQSFV